MESGSTPASASVARNAIVGCPADTRGVRSLTTGGLTSFTHERNTYAPATERPVNGLRPESTETKYLPGLAKTVPAVPVAKRKSGSDVFTFTGVPAYPWTSFSSREPRNHGWMGANSWDSIGARTSGSGAV